MRPQAIISRAESLQILANDLRKAALNKRASELKDASAETRKQILAEIDREVKKELRHRSITACPGTLLF